MADEVAELCKGCGGRPAIKGVTLCQLCWNRELVAIKADGGDIPSNRDARHLALLRATGRDYAGKGKGAG